MVTPAHHVDLIQAFSTQVNSISVSPWEHTISTRLVKYAYNHKLKAINQLFPNYLTSRDVDISWPVWSPDLSACDYFLLVCWAYRAQFMLTNHKIFQNWSWEFMQKLPECGVTGNMHSKLEECLHRAGGQLEYIISKSNKLCCIFEVILLQYCKCSIWINYCYLHNRPFLCHTQCKTTVIFFTLKCTLLKLWGCWMHEQNNCTKYW